MIEVKFKDGTLETFPDANIWISGDDYPEGTVAIVKRTNNKDKEISLVNMNYVCYVKIK